MGVGWGEVGVGVGWRVVGDEVRREKGLGKDGKGVQIAKWCPCNVRTVAVTCPFTGFTAVPNADAAVLNAPITASRYVILLAQDAYWLSFLFRL